MKKLLSLLSNVFAFLKSDKGQAAIKTAAELVPKAAPIVAAIGAASGNKTAADVASLFAKYGVTFSEDYLAMGPGRAMMHLATSVLSQELPGVSTRILDAAVQLAVTGEADKA
jgi:hypothetical protein